MIGSAYFLWDLGIKSDFSWPISTSIRVVRYNSSHYGILKRRSLPHVYTCKLRGALHHHTANPFRNYRHMYDVACQSTKIHFANNFWNPVTCMDINAQFLSYKEASTHNDAQVGEAWGEVR